MEDPRPPDRGIEAEFDWSVTTPAMAVVETVAAATGREPLDLDHLQGAVDPDALDALMRGGDGTDVSFSYEGHVVTASGDGCVRVSRTE